MTCIKCRAECEDNETDPECDETGERCRWQEIELEGLPALAYELYWISTLEHVGALIFELRTISLSAFEAEEVAFLIEIVAAECLTVQNEQRKEQEREWQTRGR